MPFIIHRKPPYHVYIEQGPEGAMAHLAELPGCYAVGSSPATAMSAVPGAIVEFLAWLRSHSEPLVPEAYVSRPSSADLFLAEVRREGAPLVAGSKAEMFDFDLAPLDDEQVERALRWLKYSREDLLSRIEGLSDEQLKEQQVAPGRSLWDTLWHVANAEYGYALRVAAPNEGPAAVTDEPSGVRERLAVVRSAFEREMRKIPAEKRNKVIYPTWARRPDEPWTMRKALRRALEHEREHLREIG